MSADLQMYGTNMRQPDPDLFMTQFVSTEASAKANKWQGRNISRWKNEEYDRTNKVQVPLSGWDTTLWLLKDWFREA